MHPFTAVLVAGLRQAERLASLAEQHALLRKGRGESRESVKRGWDVHARAAGRANLIGAYLNKRQRRAGVRS